MYCCPTNGANQHAVDTSAGVSVPDEQSRPKPLFRNLTPIHVFKFPKLDSLIDADSPWMLLQVPSKTSSKIPGVRAALEMVALNLSLLPRAYNLLAYVVIRLDVVTKSGAGRC